MISQEAIRCHISAIAPLAWSLRMMENV